MNYPMLMSTEAGLNTNVNAQVCDADDRPVPGMSYGLNCITFGRLLGRNLAAGKFLQIRFGALGHSAR